jgi:hypothetical protein
MATTIGRTLTRVHYNAMYLTRMMERIADSSPRGADMSWKYQSPASLPTNRRVTLHIDPLNANHGPAPFVGHFAVDVLLSLAFCLDYPPLRASNGEV